MSIYDYISHKDKELFSIWGPCYCQFGYNEKCGACLNAERIEREGLDWEDEYQKHLKEMKALGEG